MCFGEGWLCRVIMQGGWRSCFQSELAIASLSEMAYPTFNDPYCFFYVLVILTFNGETETSQVSLKYLYSCFKDESKFYGLGMA